MAELPTARGRIHAHLGVDPSHPGGAAPILNLARAAAAGDERAIALLYERRFALVFNATRAATGRDEHFCLDVVQETFLRILRAGHALSRVRDDQHTDRWLTRVAQSAALDLLRSEQRRTRRERAAAKTERQSHEPHDATATHIAILERTLRDLPPEDLALLRMRSTGMTFAAIAEALGATIGAVHGRLRRLTATLRGSHQEHDHE